MPLQVRRHTKNVLVVDLRTTADAHRHPAFLCKTNQKYHGNGPSVHAWQEILQNSRGDRLCPHVVVSRVYFDLPVVGAAVGGIAPVHRLPSVMPGLGRLLLVSYGQRISCVPADDRNEYFKIPIPLWFYLSLAVGLHITSRDHCCHRLSDYWPEGKPPFSQIGACCAVQRRYWTHHSSTCQTRKFSRSEMKITQVVC